MAQGKLFAQVLDPANRANPYPLYARLRETPVALQEDGSYVVSTYREIGALLHDPRISSDERKSTQGAGALASSDRFAQEEAGILAQKAPEAGALAALAEQYNHISAGPEAGDRAPDGHLLDRSGQATSLFAHFRTPHFRLLLFQGRSSAADVADLASIGQKLRETSGGLVRACLIVGPQDATSVLADDLILLRDPEHGTHTTYGASSSCLYLVRPDGYVGFRSRTADESKLIDYLRRNFAMGYMA